MNLPTAKRLNTDDRVFQLFPEGVTPPTRSGSVLFARGRLIIIGWDATPKDPLSYDLATPIEFRNIHRVTTTAEDVKRTYVP